MSNDIGVTTKAKNIIGAFFNTTYNSLRVEPERVVQPSDPKDDRLSHLMIMLFVFSIAFWFRFYVRNLITNEYGGAISNFKLIINEKDTLGLGKFLGVAPGETVAAESYADYTSYYIDYVNAFVDGWNPYSGNRTPEDSLNGYVYGPFYIYLISIGKSWFGLTTEDSIIYSNIIFDSATYVMVYVLAQRVTGNVNAMFIALIGSFSPVALFYANVKVLNAPQMNFFTLVFIYFFLEHRDIIAGFFLAVASLTKQIPLFLAMPFGLWMVRRYGFTKGTAIFLFYILFMVLLSVPWIIVSPISYFTRLYLPGQSSSVIRCPENGVATTLVAGEIDQTSCSIYEQTKNPNDVVVSDFGIFIHSLTSTHILFFGFLGLFALTAFFAYDYLENNPKLYLRFFAGYMGIGHATIARGIYKYYLTLMIPLFILSLIPGNKEKSLHIRLGAILKQSGQTLLNPKIRQKDADLIYWLTVISFFTAITGLIWVIIGFSSMFTHEQFYERQWIFVIVVVAIIFILKPNQGEDKLVLETHQQSNASLSRSLGPIIIILVSFGTFIKWLTEQYFDNNTNKINWTIILGITFVSVWLALPILHSLLNEGRKSVGLIQFDFVQIISDLVYFIVAYYFFLNINREIILIDRYFTTAIVFAISIFIFGLMGGEFWSSLFIVPYRFLLRFIEAVAFTYENNYQIEHDFDLN